MKVLVTGSSGFLGRHLLKKIESLGWEIHISNTKIANLSNLENLFIYNQIKFDYIFHLAAHTKAGDYCLYHKGEQFEINQTINTNILKYWREYQSQAKMIAMGTSCSYSPELTLTEDNYLRGEPEKGLYTYAMTKRMLLIGLQSYAEQFGLKYLYYVPSTLYGPDFDVNDSHFIFDLIKKIYRGKHKGDEVVLWGDGNQRRELIFIDDVIEIIIKSLHLNNEILNLGTSLDYSIKEYASKICEIIGYDKESILYDETRYTGVRSKKLSIHKLQSLVQVDYLKIEDGLDKTISYYRNISIKK